MSKLYQIVVVVCALVGAIICDADPKKFREFKEQIRKECQEKTKVSSELIDGLQAGNFPEGNKDLKCYVGCNLEHSKLIKGGKFDKETATQMIDTMLPENLRDGAKKALNSCVGKTESITDPCELAWEIIKCWKNEKTIL